MAENVDRDLGERPDAQFLFEAMYGYCAVVQACQLVEVTEAISDRTQCSATELLSALEAYNQHRGRAPTEMQLADLVKRRKTPIEPKVSTIMRSVVRISAYDQADLDILREFGY